MNDDQKNTTFQYTYSAREQEELKRIRNKYLPKEENKMELLRRLDAQVTQKATMYSIIVGVIGALILGTGMSCCLVWTDSVFAFVMGIIVGVIGMAILALAYPVYNRTIKTERERIAPEVLRLTEDLMKWDSCMNTKMNQRRLATIAKIESAFLSQFQRKTIREITVTDICEQAEINRCTFYENYDGISDLAKSICRQIEETASQMPHENGEYAWLFEYVLMHKSVFDVYFKIGAPLESDDYRSAYLRNGIYAVVKAWYKAGCQESAEEMDQLLKRII